MPRRDFDLQALYDAIDQERRARQLTWAQVAREVNKNRTPRRPIRASTITSLREKPVGEGDGILQMLLWLRRSPESFIPGFVGADDRRFQLPELTGGQILRWDTRALHASLDNERRARGLTWAQAAAEIGRFTPAMLTNLSKGGRIGFPRVMRLVVWLNKPAVTFTRIAPW